VRASSLASQKNPIDSKLRSFGNQQGFFAGPPIALYEDPVNEVEISRQQL